MAQNADNVNLGNIDKQNAQIKTILLATDGSTPSIMATQYAVALAKVLGARLKAIFVSTNDDELLIGRDSLKEIRPSTAGLEVVKLYATKNGINCEIEVICGNVPKTIIGTAEKYSADMIIIGNTGRTGLRRLALGSVAEAVVGSSRIPVLVLKAN